VQRAYDTIMPINPQLAILQCTAGYPAAFEELDLRVIATYRERFPDAVIGFSSHDNGIAMPVAAYMLGARIVEKHFTLNRAMKGTDHAFSLEPVGLRKMVRDLERTHKAMGDGVKKIYDSESAPHRQDGQEPRGGSRSPRRPRADGRRHRDEVARRRHSRPTNCRACSGRATTRRCTPTTSCPTTSSLRPTRSSRVRDRPLRPRRPRRGRDGACGKLGPVWVEPSSRPVPASPRSTCRRHRRRRLRRRSGARRWCGGAPRLRHHGPGLDRDGVPRRPRSAGGADRAREQRRHRPATRQPGGTPPLAGPADGSFRRMVEVNLLGTFQVTQVFGALMAAHGGGSIINIGSLYASVSPDPHFYDHLAGNAPFIKSPAYGASKAGVVNLSKFFATHWAAAGCA
jgi:hypothetical protein